MVEVRSSLLGCVVDSCSYIADWNCQAIVAQVLIANADKCVLAESQELQRLYQQGEDGLARKRAMSQAHNRSQSKPRRQ